MANANRKYKDSLFTMLFSDRKNLLSLYNAVNHSNYEKEEDLIVNTIENAVYLGVHNDVSFLMLASQIRRKIAAGSSLEKIREDLGSDIPEIKPLYDLIQECGADMDAGVVLKLYREKTEKGKPDEPDTDL